jgi:hypothetical protein
VSHTSFDHKNVDDSHWGGSLWGCCGKDGLLIDSGATDATGVIPLGLPYKDAEGMINTTRGEPRGLSVGQTNF